MTDTQVNDALADFTRELAASASWGGTSYRDGPFTMSGEGGYDWYRRSWLARAAVDMLPDLSWPA